jgi:hypothetical protein
MVYQLTNRFQDALDSYNLSLKIAEEIRDEIGIRANNAAIEALKKIKPYLFP